MRPRFLFLALGISLAMGACSGSESDPSAAKPAITRPIGRGVIVDPRKSKPLLEKARKAAADMEQAGRTQEGEINKIQ